MGLYFTSCLLFHFSSQEGNQNVIKQHLFEEFGFSDVVFERVVISCSSESEKVGSFKANLRGSNAEQLAALIRERGTTTLILKNGYVYSHSANLYK